MEQNVVGIDTVVSAAIDALDDTHNTPKISLCVNTTSPTKPEVHKVSESRHERTEQRPRATCTKLVKFGRVNSEICRRTNRQANRHIHDNTSLPFLMTK